MTNYHTLDKVSFEICRILADF